MLDAKTNAALQAIKEAQARGVIERRHVAESEYLKQWDDWIAISEAAIRGAGLEVPWLVPMEQESDEDGSD